MYFALTLRECMELSDSMLDSSGDSLTQKAIIFCILDPRPYAPPLETPKYRLIYLRLSSEIKLGIPPTLIESLISHGFKSLTLLSLISDKHLRILGRVLRLDGRTLRNLKNSLRKLNMAPLEPLYSYKKYIIVSRRNNKSLLTSQRLLDSLSIDKPSKVPKKRCILPPFTSKPPPPLPRLTARTQIISSSAYVLSPHLLGYCPLLFCPQQATPMDFPQLFKHIILGHTPYRAKMKDIASRYTGSVELEFKFGEAVQVSHETLLWFGPTEFLFDGIPFYELVYRISVPNKKKGLGKMCFPVVNYYIFWVFVGGDAKTAEGYSYIINFLKEKDSSSSNTTSAAKIIGQQSRRNVTSFEENPLAIYSRTGCSTTNDQSNTNGGAYFIYDENQLRQISHKNGSIKYLVKIYKNRLNNNNGNNKFYSNKNHQNGKSNAQANKNYINSKRRQHYNNNNNNNNKY